MDRIEIRNKNKTPGGWEFLVAIADDRQTLQYAVSLDEDYYNEVTNEQITPDELIIKAFKFLIRREGKHSILRKFNLREIHKYFPDFEEMTKVD
jgi:hypothetical protein